MSRPRKGVGEHRKPKTKIKGPLLVTTALLTFYPICMAEAATSSFEKSPLSSSSATYGHLQPFLKQSKQLGQQQSLPKSYRGLLQPASLLPSIEDLNNLKSTLSRYENQLKTLSISQAKDPLNAPTLSKSITDVEDSISELKKKIVTAEKALTALKNTQITLQEALTKLQGSQNTLTNAQNTKNSAKVTLDSATADKSVKEQSKASSQASLSEAQTTYTASTTKKQLSDASLTQQQEASAQALLTLNERQAQTSASAESLAQAQATYNEASSNLNAASGNLIKASIRKAEAQAELNTASSKLQTKQSEVNTARAIYDQTVATYNHLLDVYTNVYDNYLIAQTNQAQAQTNLIQAQNTLNQAQIDYDTLLIPDPRWTPLTYEQEHIRLVETVTLVPRTITTLTGGLTADVFNRQGYNNAPPLPTANEVPISTQIVSDINFNWGGGNVLNSNRSEDVIVRFTGNISFPTSGYYQFYSPADDGTILLIDGIQVTNDWRDKGGGGSTSAPIYLEGGSTHSITLYYYENGGGANVWLYYYTPNTGYQLVPSSYLGTTATTETIYVEETTYTYETYYTTEVVPGQVHPLINDPSLLPALQEAQAAQQAALTTFNEADSAWKVAQDNQQQAAQDSLAGYYQVIDDAISLNALSSELDVDQNAFNDKIATYSQADSEFHDYQLELERNQQSFNSAQVTLNEAHANSDAANSQLQQATQNYNAEAAKSQELQTLNEALSLEVASNKIILDAKQEEYNKTAADLDIATLNETSSQAAYSSAEQATLEAQTLVDANTQAKTDAEAAAQETETLNEASFQNAELLSSRIQPLIDAANEILNKEPEQGSTEIPAVIENLMDVDLNAVDPTELTPAQAEQLVEAALVAFETATEGSPEYEQALEALYLAAEQDDIELSEELAAIPGLAGAVEVLNFLGNAGADMSPKVREESEKVVVATVIAAGAAIQAATGAATSAAVSASAPSGGGSRRIGK